MTLGPSQPFSMTASTAQCRRSDSDRHAVCESARATKLDACPTCRPGGQGRSRHHELAVFSEGFGNRVRRLLRRLHPMQPSAPKAGRLRADVQRCGTMLGHRRHSEPERQENHRYSVSRKGVLARWNTKYGGGVRGYRNCAPSGTRAQFLFPSKAGGVHAVDVSRSHDAWSSRQARCATAARGGTTTLWGRRPGSPIGRERPGP